MATDKDFIIKNGLVVGGEITANSGIALGDNDKATFGAGDDLQIYHDGSNSFIHDFGTGNLSIKGTNLTLGDSGGNDYIVMTDTGTGGTVEIKHNAVTKLATTSTGIDVTGTATMDGLLVEGETAGQGASIEVHATTSEFGDALLIAKSDNSNTFIHAGVKIHGSGNPFYIYQSNGSATNTLRFNYNGFSDTGGQMTIGSSGDISFYEDTGSTAKFFWDASEERLGIGTASPSTALDISATTGAIKTTSSTGTNIAYNAILNTGGGLYLGLEQSTGGGLFASTSGYDAVLGHTGAYKMHFATSNTIRTTIDSSGNVGIGTTSPITALHAGTTGGNAYSSTITKSSNMKGGIFTQASNGDDMVGVYFATGSTTAGTHWSGITGSRSDNASHWGTQLNFYTHNNDVANLNDATQKMVIKGDGKVGIGISTPTELLHVDGRIKANNLTLASLSAQNSEATAVMIDGSGIIGTRELGSNAFNSTSYLTGNQTITLGGDVQGSGTTSITVSVNDDSHNHIISNVDGLQTALDGKAPSSTTTTANAALPKAGGTMTGTLAMGANAITSTGTISSGALTVTSSSTSSFNGTGYVNFSTNVGGVGVNGTQGLHIGWNKSNGGREINMIFDGGTTQAETEMIFTSTDGTNYSDIFQINGGGDVDIKNGGLRIANTTVIDSSRNLTNIGTGNFAGDVTLSGGSGKIIYTGMGTLLHANVPAFSSVPVHDLLYWGWTSSTSDYIYLKAGGNSTSDHGTLVVADNGLFYGVWDNETGAISSSTTNPISTTRFRVDASGNATFSGTISSGAITATGHIQSAGALKVTETGTAQVIMIGNQDSGGVNTPAMIMGVNGTIRIGHGSSWSGEGGTFTEKIAISGSDLKITSGGLILNATTVIDSSRNLTNIASYNGYAPSQSSSSTNSVYSADTRNVNTPPTDRARGLYVDFKTQSVIGLTGSGTYAGVLTFRSYGSGSDMSGGQPIQIAYDQAGNLQTRYGASSSWGSWKAIHLAGNDLSAGTISSTYFNTTSNVSSTGDGGLQISNGARLGFDQSGTRSWTIKAASGYLSVFSGDGLGDFNLGGNNMGFRVNGTLVLDSSRNLTNIGTISTSGNINVGANGILDVTTLRVRCDNDTSYSGAGLTGGISLWSTGATTSQIMFKPTSSGSLGNHGFCTDTYNTYFVMDTTNRGWVFRNHTTATNVASISNTGGASFNNGIKINATTIVDSSRNLTNIGTISSGAITSTGNSIFTGSSSSGYALQVLRGSDSAAAFRILNTGEVLVENNYFYVAASQGSYFDSAVRFRGTISNDTGTNVTFGQAVNVNGDIKVSGTTVIDASRNITCANFQNTGGAKIEVQDSADGGSSRGIYIWNSGDPNWVIYMSTAGAGKSSAGGTACSGLDGRTSHGIRYRVANSTTQIGHVFENASEQALFQIQPDTGNIFARGNVTAYASDARLKTNIKTIENPIEKIKKIRGVEFDWLDNIEETHQFKPKCKRETGVIAQEIEEVIPDAISPAPFNNEYKTVEKDKIVALLIEGIKEQQKQIEELKEEVSSLRSKI